MADVPPTIDCPQCPTPDPTSPESLEGPSCAYRVFTPPAAIHFHGPGFYATDVKGKIGRKRRPNPGDDLYRDNDLAAERIAAAI
jgi:hypothetical protein